MLAVKGRKNTRKSCCAKKFKNDIPSSYAKIWGETKFQYPRSGSKVMSVEEERERERAKVSVNNGHTIRQIKKVDNRIGPGICTDHC